MGSTFCMVIKMERILVGTLYEGNISLFSTIDNAITYYKKNTMANIDRTELINRLAENKHYNYFLDPHNRISLFYEKII